MTETATNADKNKSRATLSIGKSGANKPQQVRQTLARGQSNPVQVESKRRRTLVTDKKPPTQPAQTSTNENAIADKLSAAERKKRAAALEAVALEDTKQEKTRQRLAEEAARAEAAEKKTAAKQTTQEAQNIVSENDKASDSIAAPPPPSQAAIDDNAKTSSKVTKARNTNKTASQREKEEQELRTNRPNSGRGERRRREGKLTINDALNDEERVKTLSLH